MTTLNQSQKNKKKFRSKFIRVKALQGCPQKRGICTKVVIMNPKKPNSADRKVAKLRLTTKRKVLAYIVGLGHNLQEHASVLIKGGRVRDLPGMHYRLVKGKLDFSWKEVFGRRKQRRSKYGVPTIKGPKMRRRKKKHKKKIVKVK